MIRILSNGSHCAGAQPDSLERLLEVLAEYPLDRTFEAYGNFVQREPKWIDVVPLPGGTFVTRPAEKGPYPGQSVVVFFGNFHGLSHAFNIHTDEWDVIKKLFAAIQANQQRPDYIAQPAPAKQDLRLDEL